MQIRDEVRDIEDLCHLMNEYDYSSLLSTRR